MARNKKPDQMREHIHPPAYRHEPGKRPVMLDDHIHQPRWDEPTRRPKEEGRGL